MGLKTAVNLFYERDALRDSQRDTWESPPETSGTPPPATTQQSTPNPRIFAGFTDVEPGSGKSAAWDLETAALIERFLVTSRPAEPFEFHPGVTIANPARFWEYLRGDIAAGPTRARGYTGAFDKDLRRIAELFGGSVRAQ